MIELTVPMTAEHYDKCLALTRQYFADLRALELANDPGTARFPEETIVGAVTSSAIQLLVMAALEPEEDGDLVIAAPVLFDAIGAGLGCIVECESPGHVQHALAYLGRGVARGVRQTQGLRTGQGVRQ